MSLIQFKIGNIADTNAFCFSVGNFFFVSVSLLCHHCLPFYRAVAHSHTQFYAISFICCSDFHFADLSCLLLWFDLLNSVKLFSFAIVWLCVIYPRSLYSLTPSLYHHRYHLLYSDACVLSFICSIFNLFHFRVDCEQ